MPLLTRRTLLALGASGVCGAGALGVCAVAGCSAEEPHAVLRLAAGPEGGPYETFGRRLAVEVHRAHDGLTVQVLDTAASVRNLQLIGEGGAELGLTLADTAADAIAGRASFAQPVAVAAVARLYLNYLHLVVLSASPVRTVGQLAGRAVSLGAAGSGTSVVAERVLAAAGVDSTGARRLGLTESVAALRSGQVDAFFWSGGVPTRAIADLAADTPIRLVPLGETVTALRRTYGPVYESVAVPADAYRAQAPADTLGTPSYLVCHAALPTATVRAVSEVLFRSRDRLQVPDAPGSRLDERYAIGTGTIPLHPGAAAYYRSVYG
ncbi:TAXI family TRAP transporter solute-binding subunit [Kitasatospora sp. GP82]|uniref:TAXI family TRAP transporter solute-binding subunit n=1 Tax=Kitasatospora sp. GP82 TaxID=3035089 RepID=UPI0024742BE5|nr:TAXI family TRAP transporter solute-binding subunit [Kitasatospora sp. GP82]MDH6124104.1 TRAP transporter TAXI family solute receptor [Kitasatospora sp. GP82]